MTRTIVQICVLAFVAAAGLTGCGSNEQPATRYITENEAALIQAARAAAVARGRSLERCIYSVRRDGGGWVVQIDRAPGYDGSGEPLIIEDATCFVHLDADKVPTRLLSFTEDIDLTAPAPPQQTHPADDSGE
jgi:hypothetical protein